MYVFVNAQSKMTFKKKKKIIKENAHYKWVSTLKMRTISPSLMTCYPILVIIMATWSKSSTPKKS
jgi:hypothetical protein